MLGFFFDLLHAIAAGAVAVLGLGYDRDPEDCARMSLLGQAQLISYEPGTSPAAEPGEHAGFEAVSCEDEKPRRPRAPASI
mgnify:CR=1 FL=1